MWGNKAKEGVVGTKKGIGKAVGETRSRGPGRLNTIPLTLNQPPNTHYNLHHHHHYQYHHHHNHHQQGLGPEKASFMAVTKKYVPD